MRFPMLAADLCCDDPDGAEIDSPILAPKVLEDDDDDEVPTRVALLGRVYAPKPEPASDRGALVVELEFESAFPFISRLVNGGREVTLNEGAGDLCLIRIGAILSTGSFSIFSNPSSSSSSSSSLSLSLDSLDSWGGGVLPVREMNCTAEPSSCASSSSGRVCSSADFGAIGNGICGRGGRRRFGNCC